MANTTDRTHASQSFTLAGQRVRKGSRATVSRAIDLVFAAARCSMGRVYAVGKRGGWSVGLMGVLLSSSSAFAGPEGAQVVRGDVSITRNGTETLIRAGRNSIINYRNFDIGANESVRFLQPDAQSRVLNRIYSGSPTRIDGSLSANGRVYLVNPAGVLFSGTARLDVNRLYAAAGNIQDNDFIRGINRFTDLKGNVINEGLITSDFVALLGKTVGNSGQIIAPQGTVVMASGEDILVGERNGNMFVRIEGKAGEAIAGATSNTGTIDARKGTVTMGAGDVYSMAMRIGGTVKAKTVKVQAKNGEVHVTGTIDASNRGDGTSGASNSGGRGGSVEITGEKIALHSEAVIDASGTTGGGSVRVGGDVQGKGLLPTADYLYTAPGSQISADATQQGRGGSVVVWSDQVSRVYGDISAKGGREGGNGGFIETSSKGILDLQAKHIDASAPKGNAGLWLLDPIDVTISSSPDFAVDPSPNFNPNASGANVSVTSIEAALNLGTSVTVTTTPTGADPGEVGNIVVSAPITMTGVFDAVFTLQAANNITISNPITASAGQLGVTLTAGGNVAVEAAVDTNGGIFTSSGFNFQNTAAISALGGVIVNHTGTIEVNGTLSSGSATMALTGTTITQNSAITSGTLTLAGLGSTTLTNTSNAITALAGTRDGVVSITNSTPLAIAAAGFSTVDDAITLSLGANSLTIGGALSSGTASLTLSAGAVTQSAAITSGALIIGSSGSGAFVLTNTGNGFDSVTGTVGGPLNLFNSRSFTVTGFGVSTFNAGALSLEAAATRTITLNAAASAGAANDATVTADLLAFGASGSIVGANILFQPQTAGQTIGIGGGAGTTTIAAADLPKFITSGTLTVGRVDGSASGTITTGNLDLSALGYGLTLHGGAGGSIDIAGALLAASKLLSVRSLGTTAFTGAVTTSGSGGVRVESNGAVTQSAAITAPTLTLVGTGAVTLTDSGNDFGTLAGLGTLGNTVSIRDTTGLVVAGIAAAGPIALRVDAGAVTQSGPIGTPTLTLEGAATYTLTDTLNNILTLSSIGTLTTVAYTDVNSYDVSAITVSGGLTLGVVNGTVTQSGIITAPTLALTGSSNALFTLTSGNDIGVLSSVGTIGAVSFTDANTFDIGLLTSASTIELNATGPGTVTQSGTLTATTLTLAGPANYTLTNTGNSFTTLAGTGTVGGAVSIFELNGFDVAGFTTAGPLTLEVGSGTVTQSGAIITPTLTLNGTGAFTLNNTSNDVDTLLTASGVGAVAFADSDNFVLGAFTGASTLSLNAGSGTVTQSGPLTATTLTLAGAGAYSLTNSLNSFTTLVGTPTVGGAVSIFELNGFNVAGFTTAGPLTLEVGSGTVTQSGAIVTPTLTLNGTGAFTLNNTSNDVDTLLTASGVGAVAFADSDNFVLGAFTSASTLSLSAGSGTVTQSGPLTATALTLNGAGAFTLTNIGNDIDSLASGAGVGAVIFVDSDDFALGAYNGTSSLSLTAGSGTVTQSGALAATTLTLAGPANYTLTNTGNSFTTLAGTGTVGGAVSITEANGFAIAGLTTGGALTVELLAGTLTQSGAIIAPTLTLIGSGGFTLNNVNNNITTLATTGTVGTLAYTDANSVDVSGITSTGTVTLGAVSGTLTQSGAIIAPSLVLTGAGAFTLANSSNDVDALSTTGTVGQTSFRDADDFAVGTFASSGNVSLQAGSGTVTQSGAITATTLTLIGSGAFLLNNTNNNITTLATTGTVGTLAYTDANSVDVSGITSIGTVTLGAVSGTLTQSGAIIAPSLVLTGAGAFTLANSSNDVDTLSTTGTVGQTSFRDADDFTIATFASSGNVSLQAGSGTVTQTGIINADSLLLRGAASYTLTSVNLFSTLASDASGALNIFEDGGFTVGTLFGVAGINSSNASVTLTSTGGITIAASSPVNVGAGTLTMSADGINGQSAPITASSLVLLGTGTYVYGDASNTVSAVSGIVSGDVTLVSSVPLDVVLTAGAISLTSPSITVLGATSGSSIRFFTDSVAINSLMTSASTFLLENTSAGRTIGIAGGTGDLELSLAELGQLNISGSVFIGSDDAGLITANAFSLPGLSRSFSLTLRGASVSTAGITLDTGDRLTLHANTTGVTQSGPLVASNLELLGTGTFQLDAAQNQVDTLAGNVVGSVAFLNTALTPLTIGSVGVSTGLVSGGNNIEITAIAGITVAQLVNAGIGRVTLTTNAIDIAGPVTGNASSGGVILRLATNDVTSMLLGSSAAGFALSQSEVNNISTTSSLIISDNGFGATLDASSITFAGLAGDVCLSGASSTYANLTGPTNASLILENTAGTATQTGPISAFDLGLTGAGSFTLTNVNNAVSGTFASNAAGQVSFVATSLNLGVVTADCLGAPITGLGGATVFLCAPVLTINSAISATSVTLKADQLAINANVTSTGLLAINQVTDGRDINLGGANDILALTLETFELARLFPGTLLDIGNAQSGSLEVVESLTFDGTHDLALRGQGFAINGGINVGANLLTLNINTRNGNAQQLISGPGIIATRLELDGDGDGNFVLANPANDIDLIDGAARGSINYVDVNSLIVTSTGLSSTGLGDIELTAPTSLTINGLMPAVGNDVVLTTDTIDVSNTIDANTISLRNFSAARSIGVGAGPGDLSLTGVELSRFAATQLVTIGTTTAGLLSITDVSVAQNVNPQSFSLTLIGNGISIDGVGIGGIIMDIGDLTDILTLRSSGGAIVQTPGGQVIASNLVLLGSGSVALNNTSNDVFFLAGNTSNTIAYTNRSDSPLEISQLVTPDNGTITGLTSANNNITLTAQQALTVGSLLNAGAGRVTISTDNIAVNALVTGNATAGGIILQPASIAVTTIGVGTAGAGFNFTQGEINNLSTTSSLVITSNGLGSSIDISNVTFAGTAGDVCLTGANMTLAGVTGPANNALILENTSGLATQSGPISAFDLGLTGAGAFGLTDEANTVSSSFGSDALGGTEFVATGTLNYGLVTADCVIGNIGDGSGGSVFLCAPILNINTPISGTNVILKANALEVNSAVTASGTLSVFQLFVGRPITLGGSEDAGAVTLRAAEVDRLFPGTSFVVGNTDTGLLTVAESFVFPSEFDVDLTGQGIALNGGLRLDALSSLILRVNTRNGNVSQLTSGLGIEALNLTLVGSGIGNYSLANPLNDVANIAGVARGNLAYVDLNSLRVSESNITTNGLGDVSLLAPTSLTLNGTITAINRNVTLTTDLIGVDSEVEAANVTIANNSSGRTIGVGTGAGDLSITGGELSRLITGGVVTIGSSTSGLLSATDVSIAENPILRSYSLTLIGNGIAISGGVIGGVTMDIGDLSDVLTLNSTGGAISQSNTGPVVAVNLVLQGSGPVTLDNPNNSVFFMAGATTAPLTFVNNQTTALQIGEIVTLDNGTVSGLTSGNNNIFLTSRAQIEAIRPIDAGSARVSLTTDLINIGALITGNFGSIEGQAGPGIELRTFTPGTTISVGSTSGTFNVTQEEIAFLATTSGLVIAAAGNSGILSIGPVTFAGLSADICLSGSNMTIAGITLAPGQTLVLENSAGIATQTGAILATNLGLIGAGGFSLTNGANTVTTLASNTTLQTEFVSDTGYTVGIVTAKCGGAPITPGGALCYNAPSITINTPIAGTSVKIITDALALNSTVTSTLGTSIRTRSNDQAIVLGGDEIADTLSITDLELSRLILATDSLLSIGSNGEAGTTNAGPLAATSLIFADNHNVTLRAALIITNDGITLGTTRSLTLGTRTGGVVQGATGQGIIAGNLILNGQAEGGDFILRNASNNITTIEAAIGGQLDFQDADALTVTANGITTTNDAIRITSPTRLSIVTNGVLNAGSSSVRLESDEMDIGGAVTGNAGILVQPVAIGRAIELGGLSDVTGALNLSATELGFFVCDKVVTIGHNNSDAGNLSAGALDFTAAGLNRDFTLHLLGSNIALKALSLKADKALILDATNGNITLDGSIVAPGGAVAAGSTDPELAGTFGFAARATGSVFFGAADTTSGLIAVTTTNTPILIQGPAVLVATNTTLSSGSSGESATVRFTSTIDSAASERNNLTLNSPLITLVGAIGGPDGGSAQLGNFTTDAGGQLTFSGSSIRTAGDIFIGENLILTADTVIDSTAGAGGTVAFNDTINSDSELTPRSLAVNSGGSPGITRFAGDIGGINILSALSTNANGTTFLPTIVRTIGSQQYLDDVRLTQENTRLTASAVNFDRRLNSDTAVRNLTIIAPGETRFGGVVGGTIDGSPEALALASLTTDAPGIVRFNANVTTINDQLYNDAAILTNSVRLTGRGVRFVQTVNSDGTPRPLTTVAGSGDAQFDAPVGGSSQLESFTATGTQVRTQSVTTRLGQSYTGITTLDGDLTVSDQATTAHVVEFNGAVFLQRAVLIDAKSAGITFRSTLDSLASTTSGLTLNSSSLTRFDGAVGVINRLASLTTNAAGTTRINTDAIQTTNAAIFNDPTVLEANTLISASNVTFGSTLNGDNNPNRRTLTIGTSGNLAANTVLFQGTVGDVVPLGTLTIGGASAGTSAGTTLFSQALTLGGDLTIRAAELTFASTVDNDNLGSTSSNIAISSPGAVQFQSTLGATSPVGTVTIGGTNTANAGPTTFAQAVVLGGDLTTNASSITFQGTVNGDTAGTRNIILITPNASGEVTFGLGVGQATNPIRRLLVNQASTDRTTRVGGDVFTSRNAVFGGPVITTANAVTFNGGNGTLFFRSTIDAVAPGQSLTLISNATANAVADVALTDLSDNTVDFLGSDRARESGINIVPIRLGGSIGTANAASRFAVVQLLGPTTIQPSTTIAFARSSNFDSNGVLTVPDSEFAATGATLNSISVSDRFEMSPGQKLTSFGAFRIDAANSAIISELVSTSTITVNAGSIRLNGAPRGANSGIFTNQVVGAGLRTRGQTALPEIIAKSGISFSSGGGSANYASGSVVTLFATDSALNINGRGSGNPLGRPTGSSGNDAVNVDRSLFSAAGGVNRVFALDLSSIVIGDIASVLASAIPRQRYEREVAQAVVLSGAFAQPLKTLDLDITDPTTEEFTDYLLGRSLYQNAPDSLEEVASGTAKITINRMINTPTIEVVRALCDLAYTNPQRAFELLLQGDPQNELTVLDRVKDIKEAMSVAWSAYVEKVGEEAANGLGFRQYLEAVGPDGTPGDKLALEALDKASVILDKLDNLGLSSQERAIARKATLNLIGGDINVKEMEAAVVGSKMTALATP